MSWGALGSDSGLSTSGVCYTCTLVVQYTLKLIIVCNILLGMLEVDVIISVGVAGLTSRHAYCSGAPVHVALWIRASDWCLELGITVNSQSASVNLCYVSLSIFRAFVTSVMKFLAMSSEYL